MFGRLGGIDSWELDAISRGPAEQVGGEQVLFVVEPVEPVFRIIVREKDVVDAVGHAGWKSRQHLSEKDGDVGVLEAAMAVVDEDDVPALDSAQIGLASQRLERRPDD